MDEQLRGVRRLLEQVAEGQSLSPRSVAALDDARSILRRLESSWSAVLPFLDWDNRATSALLAEVAALVPGVVPAPADHDPASDEPELDFAVAHRRNLALRARLADVVGALATADAETGAVDAARARVVAHLRARLVRDPANRRPHATAEPQR